MLNDIIKDAKKRMQGAVQALETDYSHIRTGRAHPALVEALPVKYYDVPTPLLQLASIGIPEPRSILIKPFDPATVKDIEKAILASDLGLTPNSDGRSIRLNLPPLTEERRKDLVKVVKSRAEEGRVAIRNIRRDLMRDLRDYENEKMISEDEKERGEKDLQKETDAFIAKIDQRCDEKEDEILEV